jgi:hypothetical protein
MSSVKGEKLFTIVVVIIFLIIGIPLLVEGTKQDKHNLKTPGIIFTTLGSLMFIRWILLVFKL